MWFRWMCFKTQVVSWKFFCSQMKTWSHLIIKVQHKAYYLTIRIWKIDWYSRKKDLSKPIFFSNFCPGGEHRSNQRWERMRVCEQRWRLHHLGYSEVSFFKKFTKWRFNVWKFFNSTINHLFNLLKIVYFDMKESRRTC